MSLEISINCKSAKKERAFFIGVLDTFGNESTVKNSLEQLFINTVNENLHNIFYNHSIFYDQDLYLQQKVTYPQFSLESNFVIIHLIEVFIKFLNENITNTSNSIPTIIQEISKSLQYYGSLYGSLLSINEADKNVTINHTFGFYEYDFVSLVSKSKIYLKNENVFEILKKNNFVKTIFEGRHLIF